MFFQHVDSCNMKKLNTPGEYPIIFNELGVARPEGFEPPTFGFEVGIDELLDTPENGVFPKKIKRLALSTFKQF